MSKKQVLFLSIFLAIPVVSLLIVLVLNGLSHGGNMFSGMMTVVVGVTGLLSLAMVFSPLAIMAWYPADGLASLAPPPPAPEDGGKPKSSGDDDDDEEEDDGFGDDESMEFDDDESFADGDEEVYDDDAEYEDEDEKW